MKFCPRCQTSKPTTEFSLRNVRGRRMRRSWCKSCENARVKHPRSEKTCDQCGSPFLGRSTQRFCTPGCANEWQRDRHLNGQVTPVPWKSCRQCGKQFIARPSKRVFCSRECAADANRGAHRYDRRLRRSLPRLSVTIEGEPCAYCGDPATEPDHVIPLVHGGLDAHVPQNIVPACHSCNSDKQGFLLYEWYDRLEDRAERLQRELDLTRRRIEGVRAVWLPDRVG